MVTLPRFRRLGFALCVIVLCLQHARSQAQPQQRPQPQPQHDPILIYIKKTWALLTRSNHMLATAAVDPKFHADPDGRWPIYVSRSEDIRRIAKQLHQELAPAAFAKIELRVLPDDPAKLDEQGLLYLPNPYVVPGGRFNEMYGWDSYFILLGLETDHREALAKGMVDNFLFEIEHYGGVLNANRTYYLTRSQPPFLTSMIRAVYENPASFPATNEGRAEAKIWLEHAYALAEKDYSTWTRPEHVAGSTGLARYFDYGVGPVPEM